MSLQETLEIIRCSPAPVNEESAKFKIIAPILKSLGWDMFGPQVLLEYSVGDKKAGGRVDIALRGSESVVALIEAKAPGVDLSSHITQVLGYAFHEGVDICVLTTGLEWWLYLPREKGQPEERKFGVLHVLNDPVDELADDLEAFLGSHALEAGDAVSQAKRVLKAQHEKALLNQKIPSIWQKMIEEPDEELLEVISRRIYNEVNLRPNKEQIVAVLRDQPVTARPVSHEKPHHRSRPPKSPRVVTQTEGSDPTGRRPTEMLLFGKRYPRRNNIEGLKTLVEVLHGRDPETFSQLLAVRGRTRTYMSRDPDQFDYSWQVGTSDFFLNTNLSATAVWRVARLFLEHLGHRDADLEVKFD